MALDILELRKLCIPKNIRITLHAAKRLEQRRIFLKDVIACITNVFSADPYWNLGILAVPATVIWIVAITNAVNLIDGLDGLACGVSTISSMTLLVIALVVSEGNVAILMAALAGGCIGFLPYNMNPAKIFMGDTGSTFLGYILAVVSQTPTTW